MGVKTAGITNASDGATVYMWWFKARNIPKYDAPFQKVGSHSIVVMTSLVTEPVYSAFLHIYRIRNCRSPILYTLANYLYVCDTYAALGWCGEH